MYRWKSWHDSRQRLALYAAACLAIGVILGLDFWFDYANWKAWQALSHTPEFRMWDVSRGIWYWAMNVVAGLLLPAVIWSALAFGSSSVGNEYGSGAMVFVLTRPQKRWRIVWDDWMLSVAEICLVLFMLIVGIAPFLYLTSKTYVAFTGLILPGVLAVAACLYGVTQFLTLLTGSSAKGLSATVAVVLFYYMFPSALDVWWHVTWPEKVQQLSLSMFEPVWDRLTFSTWEITILWALVALIFPFLSQWLIERREV